MQANDNEEMNEENTLTTELLPIQEITGINEDTLTDNSCKQPDLNDPEWIPQPWAETQVQSNYNLRQRDRIIAPQRIIYDKCYVLVKLCLS